MVLNIDVMMVQLLLASRNGDFFRSNYREVCEMILIHTEIMVLR